MKRFTYSCFLPLHPVTICGGREARSQADHSSPQTWTTWPGDTSRYCRTGGW
ncbi:hypothetical protein FBZ95_105413 [Bradyrhizobium sacchari]|uniref:Uncharacterized protein n=1 Tax=Bradyrhizobium sacchari TaxID=1399419 RepID=A0A560JSQ6_9BRAD|nr:hypothetical protein FBZ95_105413 [Bradyrhizobium sacchari]